MEEIIYPNLPDTDFILNPPTTIFYPPVAEVPYLDPLLLPSLEQVESGLGEDQAETSSRDRYKPRADTNKPTKKPRKYFKCRDCSYFQSTIFWRNAYTRTRSNRI